MGVDIEFKVCLLGPVCWASHVGLPTSLHSLKLGPRIMVLVCGQLQVPPDGVFSPSKLTWMNWNTFRTFWGCQHTNTIMGGELSSACTKRQPACRAAMIREGAGATAAFPRLFCLSSHLCSPFWGWLLRDVLLWRWWLQPVDC